MALERITDHTRRAILHLPPPLWGKPRLASCLRAITDEIQEAEDVLWDVMLDRLLENADLVRLQTLGRLVGEPYLGYPVETYRGLIRLRLKLNSGRATIRDIIEFCNLAGVTSVVWSEDDPARLGLQLEDAEGVAYELIRRIIEDGVAAGVAVDLFFVPALRGLRADDASATVTIEDPGVWGDASGTVDGLVGPLWHRGTL